MYQEDINQKKLLLLIKGVFSAACSRIDEENETLQEFNLHGLHQKNHRRIRDIIFEELDSDLQESKPNQNIYNNLSDGNNIITFPRNNVILFRRKQGEV